LEGERRRKKEKKIIIIIYVMSKAFAGMTYLQDFW
jgi:hypothetical protein